MKKTIFICVHLLTSLTITTVHAATTKKSFYLYGGASYGIAYHEPDPLFIERSSADYFDLLSVMLFDHFGVNFSAYLPVGSALLIGATWNGNYQAGLVFNGENAFATYSTLGLSTMIFPQGQIGKGLYLRGDIGRGVSTFWEGRIPLSKNNSKLNSFIGLGAAAEIGYAFEGNRSWLLGLQGQLRKASDGPFMALHVSAGFLF